MVIFESSRISQPAGFSHTRLITLQPLIGFSTRSINSTGGCELLVVGGKVGVTLNSHLLRAYLPLLSATPILTRPPRTRFARYANQEYGQTTLQRKTLPLLACAVLA